MNAMRSPLGSGHWVQAAVIMVLCALAAALTVTVASRARRDHCQHCRWMQLTKDWSRNASAAEAAALAPVRELPPALARQILSDLSVWNATNITQRHVEQAYCGSRSHGFRVQVRGWPPRCTRQALQGRCSCRSCAPAATHGCLPRAWVPSGARTARSSLARRPLPTPEDQ